MSEILSKSSPKSFTFYPLFWLAICFSTGILTAHFFNLNPKIFLVSSLIFTFLTVIFIKQKFVLIFLFAAFFSAGGFYFQIDDQSIAPNRVKKLYDENTIKSGDPIEIEGILRGMPELSVDGFFIELDTEKAIYKGAEIKISGRIRLFAAALEGQSKNEYEQLNLHYGSRIRVACNLRREDNYLNPGVVSQKEILDQQEIDATGIIKSSLLVEKIGDTQTFSPLAWIYERRQNLIIEFRDKFNVSTAGVLIASLLGNKYFLDKPTAEVFREGGTFHVLVISGLHITFIGGLTLLFVRYFTNKRFWQFLIAVTFLWAYSIAVGVDVPVVRATIMFTILLFSQVIYRRGSLINSLGACAFILLIWRPSDLFTQSFQLTFVSVAAIVAMAFPLVESLRVIGSWSPSAEAPFPANVPNRLKRFCETLYWRESVWEIEKSRQIWSANLFKAPYLNWLEEKNLQKTARYIFEAVLVSFVAQAWLLPLTVVYFHRFSFLGILLNLWVGIIIALESFAAIFAVTIAQISDILALPFIKITEVFNWLLVSVPQIFTDNSLASVRLPHYSGSMKAIYFLYFAPLILAALFLNQWKPFAIDSKLRILNFKFSAAPVLRINAAIFCLFFCLIIFHPFSAPQPDGRLHADFLDVGQGDAALITFPDGETLLVDGGGKMSHNKISLKNEYEDESEIFEPDALSIGEAVVSRFLWEKGYSKIDYILATHADADHIQGLSDVAKNFRVDAAFFGRTPLKNAEFSVLSEILQKRKIESVKLSRGDVLNFGDSRIEVLFPEADEDAEAASDNNHSLVLRVTYGERKFLLTGDIEKEAENELLQAPEFLQSDVVKVAHHGSRTSSTPDFINASQVKIAVVSVGKRSPFGHPHEEVIERWRDSAAKILTTGENGTISVLTDGKDLVIDVFNQNKIFR